MTDKDIISKLKHMRAFRAGGEPNPEWIRATRATLMMQVDNTVGERRITKIRTKHAWQLMEMFVPSSLVQYAFRPIAVLAGLGALFFGGWITTVNASLGSVPGDALYGVKIATEQAQIALAGNATKVKLQMDFAGRRIEEVAKIMESPKPKKAERVAVAVSNLKKSVATAQENLTDLKKSDPQAVGEAIKNLDRKAEEYHIALERAGGALAIEQPVAEQVAEAKKIVTDASVKAVLALVEAHQKDDHAVTADQVLTQLDEKIKFLTEQTGKINVASSTPAQAMAKESQDALAAARTAVEAKNLEIAVTKITQASVLLQTIESLILPPPAVVPPVTTTSTTPPVVLPLPQISSGSSTVRIAPPTRSDVLPEIK